MQVNCEVMMVKKKSLPKKIDSKKEEFYFLTVKLDEINAALKGNCNDIDCDRYIYKDCLRKKYKPVLEHGFSCIPSLKREKEAVMGILSLSRYKKYRYERCNVCGKILDILGKEFAIVSFTRPCKDRKAFEYQGIQVHKRCKDKVNTPEGWEKRW
jgi:hypothetical protein